MLSSDRAVCSRRKPSIQDAFAFENISREASENSRKIAAGLRTSPRARLAMICPLVLSTDGLIEATTVLKSRERTGVRPGSGRH
jgi:hypothetical protein